MHARMLMCVRKIWKSLEIWIQEVLPVKDHIPITSQLWEIFENLARFRHVIAQPQVRVGMTHSNLAGNHAQILDKVPTRKQFICFLPVKDFLELALQRRIKVIQDSSTCNDQFRCVNFDCLCLRRKKTNANAKALHAELASVDVEPHQQ